MAITLRFEGEDRDVLRLLRQIQREEKKLGREAKNAGEESAKGSEKAKGAATQLGGTLGKLQLATNTLSEAFKGAGESGKSAFGPETIGNVAKLTAGFGLAQAAISGVKAVVSDLTRALQENSQAATEAISGLARFSNLRGLGPEDREFVLQQAESTGLATQTASGLSFSAGSAGLSDQQTAAILSEAGAAKQLGEDPNSFAGSLISLKQGVLGDRSASQISSFLGEASFSSPLSADQFGRQFTRIAGVAGGGLENQAGASALLSAQIKALGADANPEVATTAIRGFLAKRLDTSGAGGQLLSRLGLSGQSAVQQIQGLAGALGSGGLAEGDLIKGFGIETGSPLLSLLQSPTALSGIAPAQEAALRGLTDTDSSFIQERLALKASNDPQFAAKQRALRAANARDIAGVRRGFDQAGAEAVAQQGLGFLEGRGFGSALVGGVRTVGDITPLGAIADTAVAGAGNAVDVGVAFKDALVSVFGSSPTDEIKNASRPPDGAAIGSDP